MTLKQHTTNDNNLDQIRDAVADLTHRLVVEGTVTSDDEIGALEGLLLEMIRGADTDTLQHLLAIHQRDLAAGDYPDLDNPEKGEDNENKAAMARTIFSLSEQISQNATAV